MISPATDLRLPEATIDEWIFVAWTPDGNAGVISGHRVVGRTAWYWAAHVRAGYPLLHLTEWDVKVRPDPMVVKAPEMWAEHTCDDPLRQWSIGNEAYFAELDNPADALGRAYGIPTPTAFDLEWYATAEPQPLAIPSAAELCGGDTDTDTDTGTDHGRGGDGCLVAFSQVGVVHGLVEVMSRPDLTLAETPALRWRRAFSGAVLPPPRLDEVVAHTGLRAPFRFPDGAVTNWVLNAGGWNSGAR